MIERTKKQFRKKDTLRCLIKGKEKYEKVELALVIIIVTGNYEQSVRI